MHWWEMVLDENRLQASKTCIGQGAASQMHFMHDSNVHLIQGGLFIFLLDWTGRGDFSALIYVLLS